MVSLVTKLLDANRQVRAYEEFQKALLRLTRQTLSSEHVGIRESDAVG